MTRSDVCPMPAWFMKTSHMRRHAFSPFTTSGRGPGTVARFEAMYFRRQIYTIVPECLSHCWEKSNEQWHLIFESLHFVVTRSKDKFVCSNNTFVLGKIPDQNSPRPPPHTPPWPPRFHRVTCRKQETGCPLADNPASAGSPSKLKKLRGLQRRLQEPTRYFLFTDGARCCV